MAILSCKVLFGPSNSFSPLQQEGPSTREQSLNQIFSGGGIVKLLCKRNFQSKNTIVTLKHFLAVHNTHSLWLLMLGQRWQMNNFCLL